MRHDGSRRADSGSPEAITEGRKWNYARLPVGLGRRGSLTARWLPSEPCLLVALVNQDGFYVFTVSESFKMKRLSAVLVERR